MNKQLKYYIEQYKLGNMPEYRYDEFICDLLEELGEFKNEID